jgi:hypothetical protein
MSPSCSFSTQLRLDVLVKGTKITRVYDWKRAQKLSDRFAGLDWLQILERYVHYVNPLLKESLHGYPHY